MSTLSPGGINLNVAVSTALDFLHKIEEIQLLRNLGWDTDDEGNQIVSYADPVTLTAQIQNPDPSSLQHVRRINDNAQQRLFWVNESVSPIDRFSEHGGDIILYDGKRWQVTGRPDDFVKQGWACVIGEAILDDC
jgi:hypothetical protein